MLCCDYVLFSFFFHTKLHSAVQGEDIVVSHFWNRNLTQLSSSVASILLVMSLYIILLLYVISSSLTRHWQKGCTCIMMREVLLWLATCNTCVLNFYFNLWKSVKCIFFLKEIQWNICRNMAVNCTTNCSTTNCSTCMCKVETCR